MSRKLQCFDGQVVRAYAAGLVNPQELKGGLLHGLSIEDQAGFCRASVRMTREERTTLASFLTAQGRFEEWYGVEPCKTCMTPHEGVLSCNEARLVSDCVATMGVEREKMLLAVVRNRP